MVEAQRPAFEAAVVDRLKESGFLEIEIRVECLARCDDGYQDEVINAGWHYWNAAIAAQDTPSHTQPAVSTEPVAYVSHWTLGQLVADHSGDYRLTVPHDLMNAGQVSLYTAPPAVTSLSDVFAAIDGGNSITVQFSEIKSAKAFRDSLPVIATPAPTHISVGAITNSDNSVKPVDGEDEAYEIGKRDGYSDAVQQIDQLTGGDGEYRYCTDHDPDRHTPGPADMIHRIVDRFETLNLLQDAEKTGRDQEWGRAPAELSVGSRWRAFEDTTPGYWGIELEQASNDDDPIMYPIKIHRERVAIVVDAHNAEVARLESLHRSEIADMAERFRSVNVSEAVKQLADILPAAPAEHVVGVKPLEWRADRTAKALGATWMVWPYSDPLNDGLGNWLWQVVDAAPHASGRFHTEAEAKAAAQADYESRIRAALSSPMEGGE